MFLYRSRCLPAPPVLRSTIKKKEPLKAACSAFGIRHANKANLEKLRNALVRHWCVLSCSRYPSHQLYSKQWENNRYPTDDASNPCPTNPPASSNQVSDHASQNSRDASINRVVSPEDLDFDIDEAALTREYDAGDGIADEVFGGFDQGGLEEADEDEEEDEENEGLDLRDDGEFGECPFQNTTNRSLRGIPRLPDIHTSYGCKSRRGKSTCRGDQNAEVCCKVLECKPSFVSSMDYGELTCHLDISTRSCCTAQDSG